MKFSFIIPARNEAGYVATTVGSIVEQLRFTGIEYEVLVVDGESSDCTAREADLAGAAVHSLAPSTIGAARNFGASKSVGDLLIHMDADSRFHDLQGLVLRLEKEFASSVIVGATARLAVYPSEETLKDRLFHWIFSQFIRLGTSWGGLLAKGECQIVRRSAFERVGGYRDQIVVGEDCLLWRDLRRIGRLSYLRDAYVFHSPRRFRQHGYVRVLLKYAREGVWLVLFRRSYVHKWEEVR